MLSAWLRINLSILTFSLEAESSLQTLTIESLASVALPMTPGKGSVPRHVQRDMVSLKLLGFKFISASEFHAACFLVGVLVLFPVHTE